MPNTNFQTFHQMGSAISDFVKQATGRDDVQNIDMEHITVAQNHYYEEVDVSGHAVVFSAGAEGIPFEKCVVQIEPVQDLHGYDNPWPAGGGKNLIPYPYADSLPITKNGITFTDIGNGRIHVQGTAASAVYYNFYGNASTPIPEWVKPNTQYTLKPNTVSNKYFVQFILYGSQNYAVTGSTFTTPSDFSSYTGFALVLGIYSGAEVNADVAAMLEYGDTAHDWEPYSNICPITGWTMVNVYQAGQSLEDVRTFRFTFPSEAGIVYGGYVDLVAGKLVVNRAYALLNDPDKWLAMPAGTTVNFRYMQSFSDRKIYDNSYTGLVCSYMAVNAAYVTAQTGRWLSATDSNFGLRWIDGTLEQVKADAEAGKIAICYDLAEPQTYHLTPVEIRTILGQNIIWADTGDIEVKFTDLKELY